MMQNAGAIADRRLAFSTSALWKTYGEGETAVHALRGVDLDVPEGELVVLLGPSGSGKSTLLNILGGIDRPTSGAVRFREADLAAMTDRQLTTYRRNHVGFVFQFYNLMPSLTAEENVDLVAGLAAAPMSARDALDLVGLGPRAGHFPAELSGGEQQRVAIARAIVKRQTVLFCDEPTGALDSATGVTVFSALQRLNRELGATTLIITHAATTAAIADRVVWFADGRIRATEVNATPADASTLVW